MSWVPPRVGVPVADGGDSPVASPAGMSSPELDMSPDTGPASPSVAAGHRRGGLTAAGLARSWPSRRSLSSDRGMVQRPPAGTIPDAPGSYQFKDARRPRHLRGQGQVAPASGCRNYFAEPAPACRRTAPMVAAAETVEWIQVRNDVEALMLENTLIKQPPAPLQRAAARRQELPVPRRHGGRRVAAADGDARPQAQGRPLLRALRPRLRHPRDARPAAAHLPAPHLLGQQVRPAPAARPAVPAVPHREVLRARASARSTKEEYDQHVRGAARSSSTATPTRWCRSSRPGCTRRPSELEFEQAARLRDRLTSVQKAIEKQQMVAERSEDFDVLGIADDELEAAVQVFFVRKGRVVGRKGFIVDKVEDLTAGELVEQRASSGSTTTRPRASRSRCSCRSTSTTPTSTRSG